MKKKYGYLGVLLIMIKELLIFQIFCGFHRMRTTLCLHLAGRSSTLARSTMAATGSGEAGCSQRKSGHEGHEEFLVVRLITITFCPCGLTSV